MRLPNSKWLQSGALQHLLGFLNQDNEEARIIGGAVRNSLLGEVVSDIDIATTREPQKVIELLESVDIKVVPTGIEHGTVTAVVEGRPFEITTLRADIETDGRRAVVRFGRDWHEDALRRDFTINALYVDADGEIFDPLGGLADIEARRVKFIGEAEERIREDALRILRFFRFYAWYGHGAPDRDGLKACVRAKDMIVSLSAERVWKELTRTLSAPDPARAILWMRQAGVLEIVLPESRKWGIDALTRVISAQDQLGWGNDAMLRLMAIIPPQVKKVEALADRLRLSKKEHKRLEDWAASAAPLPEISEIALAKQLYGGSQQGVVDAMRLELARLRQAGEEDDQSLMAAVALGRLLEFAIGWKRPQFPVKGRDLIEQGQEPGKALGSQLQKLEKRWIDSGFMLDKAALLGFSNGINN